MKGAAEFSDEDFCAWFRDQAAALRRIFPSARSSA